MSTFGQKLHNVTSWYEKSRLQFKDQIIRTLFNAEINCLESTGFSFFFFRKFLNKKKYRQSSLCWYNGWKYNKI